MNNPTPDHIADASKMDKHVETLREMLDWLRSQRENLGSLCGVASKSNHAQHNALSAILAEREELKSENEELQALFNKQWERSREADKLWQAATGKEDVIPDLGDLLKWFMAERVELIAKLKAIADHHKEHAELKASIDDIEQSNYHIERMNAASRQKGDA